MKCVILAGGFGTRISEESDFKPKPMIEIGGKPILWHILKIYSHHGINDFIICLGYKGYLIKEYFSNYFMHNSDVTIDIGNNSTEIHNVSTEPWKITLVDTGQNTMTGGRLKRVKDYLGDEDFCLTYGDGVSDVNIKELIKYHKLMNKDATVTAFMPEGRFGSLNINKDGVVTEFNEKPLGDGGFVNAGFFVLSKRIFDLIKDDTTVWEEEPLKKLASNQNLSAYHHKGFWRPMDTLRDKNFLEDLCKDNNPPWKKWS